MGLFYLFKSKMASVSLSFKTITGANNKYNPWKKNNVPQNDNYIIAAFIRISQSGAKIGCTNDDYARYFNYEFGVSDPISYHKKVIADGYLIAASPGVALGKLKMDQLKAILANSALSNKGKKDALILRILDNVDVNSLDLDQYYIPSDKGAEHLRKYEYVFRLQRYGISWEEFDKRKELCADYFKPNDIIWQILNSRFNDYSISNCFGLARNELLGMARLLEDEEKYVDALYRYALVLYYDVNLCEINKDEEQVFAPGIITAINGLKAYYVPQIVNKCCGRNRLPNCKIDKNDFERLLFDIFEGREIDIQNYIKT